MKARQEPGERSKSKARIFGKGEVKEQASTTARAQEVPVLGIR